ncbi:MFS transporter [Pseudomaricurvus alcaniphilus]|uniref:MFS transporter n=1 Tax=Pseudomaricurvus alcaniphilus TaxID=1166482 RepID=UPI001A9FBBB9|nr:MFS transporter [Pseudomaricurvus alcaniphilus]
MSRENLTPASPDTRSQRLVLLLVCMGSVLMPFTMAAVNIAIPSMAADLQADAASIAWMPTLFLLANVALILPFGKLADNYGRKRIYLLGLALSALASLGSWFSPTIDWVLFFRVLQGASSAMIFGSSLALLTSVFPANARGLPLGLNTASVYIGLTIAPAIGGWLTQVFSWRAVFFVPIPVALGLIVIGVVLVKGEWKKDQHSRFDWIGTALFAGWALTFVTGFTKIPAGQGIVLLLASFTFIGLFIYHQSRNQEPLIRVQLFRENRMFGFSLLTAFLMYASNYPLAFLLSLYLQYIRGLSPAESGQVLLVQAIAMALIAPFSGKFSDRLQPRLLSTGGCLVTLIGFLCLLKLHEATPTVLISAALFLVGIGFGLFSSPNHNAIISSVENKDLGVASASLSLARVCGNIVAMSVVTGLIHLLIGSELITPANYPDLMQTVHIAIYISVGLVTAAAIISVRRGRMVHSPGS